MGKGAGAGLRRLSDFSGLAKLSDKEFAAKVSYPVFVISWARETLEDAATGSVRDMATTDMTEADALVVVFEPSGSQIGGMWALKLGRGVEADVMVPFETVSRMHAQLAREEAGYSLTDVGSKNGTWVNGHELDPQKSVKLKDGDRIKFGDVEGIFYTAPSFKKALTERT
jgi:pSer/pThr/pTyr-binding forkhead associated (FHA) protein